MAYRDRGFAKVQLDARLLQLTKPPTKDKENRTVNINIDMIFRLAWLATVAALVANLAWHELRGWRK